jgi:hypothetical protein
MPRSIQQEEATRRREADAFRLRMEGLTFAEIARRVGYSNASAASKAVRRFLDRLGVEEAYEARTLNYERYNAMLEVLAPRIDQGDLPAIRAALTVMDRIERLFGLGIPEPLPDIPDAYGASLSHGLQALPLEVAEPLDRIVHLTDVEDSHVGKLAEAVEAKARCAEKELCVE